MEKRFRVMVMNEEGQWEEPELKENLTDCVNYLLEVAIERGLTPSDPALDWKIERDEGRSGWAIVAAYFVE